MNKILWCDHSTETSSAVLSLGTIYLVCILESADEILWCDHSNEPVQQYFDMLLFIWYAVLTRESE